MRTGLAFVLIGTLSAGAATASSLVVLPAMTDHLGPSMIELGETGSSSVTVAEAAEPSVAQSTHVDDAEPMPSEVPPGAIVKLSASVIALGEPEVALEEVAAIGPADQPSTHHVPVVVIRGGVVGDAFAPGTGGGLVTVDPAATPQVATQAPPAEVIPPKPKTAPHASATPPPAALAPNSP